MRRTRRGFLRDSALVMFGAGAMPGWLARAASVPGAGRRGKVLVAIFQRGAADGLNVVVPFGEERYYELRPGIAIPKPGAEDGALDLDGFFGLHPRLAPLKPLYDARQLVIVHASGSPDPTRSHFDAQDYMESGTPGRKATRDGWLNRALPPESGQESPLRAVALGPTLPRTLRGAAPAVAVAGLNQFEVRGRGAASEFEMAYAKAPDTALRGTAKETFEAIRMIESIRKAPYSPSADAKYPPGRFGQSLQEIARLIKAGAGLEVAFADIGGWDHHVNEVGARPSEGQLANLLDEFGGALAAFAVDLGDKLEDVSVVTMSEFGRTARENGNRGTDHGHANAMFVLGGSVKGGKVYGDWPGLEQEQLHQNRDLAVTTDFRDVLGELATRHLGTKDLRGVFPGYAPKYRNLLG